MLNDTLPIFEVFAQHNSYKPSEFMSLGVGFWAHLGPVAWVQGPA